MVLGLSQTEGTAQAKVETAQVQEWRLEWGARAGWGPQGAPGLELGGRGLRGDRIDSD